MSFWNSRYQKARKEHKCIYCGKKILVGEKYHRETGTFEGYFNDYCLCELCKPVAMKYDSGEELSSLFTYSTIECPECKNTYLNLKRLEPSIHKYKCTCYKCKHEWEHELTLKDFGVEDESEYEDYQDEDEDFNDIDNTWDEYDEQELRELEKAQAKRFAEGKPLGATGCKCAIETDEYHGWECEVMGGACIYLTPNSKACARDYGEGPDAVNEEKMI